MKLRSLLLAVPVLLLGSAVQFAVHAAAPVATPTVAAQPVVPPSPPQATVPLDSLQPRISAYLAQQAGTYGLFVIDLASGATLGVNEDRIFPAASTAKLPQAMYILEQAREDQAVLEERIALSAEDWQDGTGVLQAVPEGTSMRVQDLVRLSITESDNIARNMLIRRFGWENIEGYMRKLGGSPLSLESGLPGTTPRAMATYMKALYDGTGVTGADLQAFLLDALTHTAFSGRIAAGVSTGVPVAHKIGTLPGVVNDVGAVLAPERPFIIAVFSLDVAEATAEAVIEELTHMIFTELVK